jgi:hypothetical protein
LLTCAQIVKAAKSAREGDHDDALLGRYAEFFKLLNAENTPSLVDDTAPMMKWFSELPRLDLILMLNT